MRVVFLITLIITLIVALSIWGYYYLKGQSTVIVDLLDDLREEVQVENWGKAGLVSQKLAERWQKASSIFPMVLDHAEFHDLAMSLARIDTMVEIKEKKLLLPEIAVARELVQGIPEQEKLSLENIF